MKTWSLLKIHRWKSPSKYSDIVGGDFGETHANQFPANFLGSLNFLLNLPASKRDISINVFGKEKHKNVLGEIKFSTNQILAFSEMVFIAKN